MPFLVFGVCGTTRGCPCGQIKMNNYKPTEFVCVSKKKLPTNKNHGGLSFEQSRGALFFSQDPLPRLLFFFRLPLRSMSLQSFRDLWLPSRLSRVVRDAPISLVQTTRKGKNPLSTRSVSFGDNCDSISQPTVGERVRASLCH